MPPNSAEICLPFSTQIAVTICRSRPHITVFQRMACLLFDSAYAMPRIPTKPMSAENRSTIHLAIDWKRRKHKRSSFYTPRMLQTINEAVSAIKAKSKIEPRVGIVLGSGLGNVVDAIQAETTIPYADIPGAKGSTVWGHSGKMILGHAGKVPVVVL